MTDAPARPFIYLNNAATSWPKPPAVLDAVHDALSLPITGGGRGVGFSRDAVADAREEVSRFLGISDPDHLVFTHNATDALNILIQGFVSASPEPFHVLSTDLDHNSVLRPLCELSRDRRLDVSFLPQTRGYVDPDTITGYLTPQTRLAVINHGSNVIGTVQQIQRIGDILQDHGVFFIVDGAQTAGHIPISLRGLPVDAFVFTGHKALFGIPGTGGFYLRDPERVRPVRYGGTGSNSASLFQPVEMPGRFEIGTHNSPGLAGLTAGVSFIRSVGLDAIEEKGRRQISGMIQALKEYETISIQHPEPDLPILSCNIAGIENDDLGFILARKYHLIVRTGLHCAPRIHDALDQGSGSVRISLSWFTTDEECRKACRALGEIAERCG